jgi:solute carrier family 25 S-adenosylmethionine transporter 26
MLQRRLKVMNEQTEHRASGTKDTTAPKASELSKLENLGIGIASAVLAGLVTQPIDVIKTRMMTQAASKAVPYTSALDCAFTVLKTEGWQKLYSGIGQRSVYMCGLWGFTFMLEPMMTEYLS